MNKALEEWLKSNNIDYKLHTHPAVFTVKEAKEHCSFIPGMHCKNLFLKDARREQYYLVTLPSTDRLEYKKIRMITGSKKVKFANEEELIKYLGLTTGAVSPLGLVNDSEKEVIYLVDQEVWNAEIVSFHPNINTESVELSKKAFQNFVKKTENKFKVVDL